MDPLLLSRRRSLVLCLAPLLFAILFVAAWMALRWPLWQSAFRSDGSPLSWLSSAQLFAGSWIVLSGQRRLPPAAMLWLGIALLGLSLDEQFQWHELWKYGCSDWLQACQFAWVRELPMLLVWFFGGSTVLWLWRIGIGHRAALLTGAAVATGTLGLAIDQMPGFASLAAMEEGFEVLAEALFLSALLSLPARAAE